MGVELTEKVIWLFATPDEIDLDLEMDQEPSEALHELLTPREYHLDSRRLILFDLPAIDADEEEESLSPELEDALSNDEALPFIKDQEILTMHLNGEFYNYLTEEFKLEYRLDEEGLKVFLEEQSIFASERIGLGFVWFVRNFPKDVPLLH
ncbi:hypothetical protein JW905_04360 [bacterium]|nr:hypothetical protein [candidate division CSSED10-310 bacterium]